MLSERLKSLRAERKMSQKELATRVFVSPQAISKWERGEATPNPETVVLLAEIFGVSTDNLLGASTFASSLNARKGVNIPVLGTVVAGIPIEAVEDILDYEEITPELATTGEFFALQVKGSSMEPRIKEGDVVIVRKQSDADTGDTVVVLVNGDEATIKKLRKGDKGITLIPNNPAYEPLYYSCDEIKALPVAIVGKVIELRAKF